MIAALATAVLALLLSAASAFDIRTGRLPDLLNLAIGVAGFAAIRAMGGDLLASAVGAGAGYIVLRTTAWLFERVRGREGLGLGDVKLFAAGGAWVGCIGLIYALLAGASLGLAFIAARSLIQRRPIDGGASVPFGPFLAAGLFVAWLLRERFEGPV